MNAAARQLLEYERVDSINRAKERRELDRKRELDRALKRRAAALAQERKDAELRGILVAQARAMGVSVEELIEQLKKGDAPESFTFGSWPPNASGPVVQQTESGWVRQRTGYWRWLKPDVVQSKVPGL